MSVWFLFRTGDGWCLKCSGHGQIFPTKETPPSSIHKHESPKSFRLDQWEDESLATSVFLSVRGTTSRIPECVLLQEVGTLNCRLRGVPWHLRYVGTWKGFGFVRYDNDQVWPYVHYNGLFMSRVNLYLKLCLLFMSNRIHTAFLTYPVWIWFYRKHTID